MLTLKNQVYAALAAQIDKHLTDIASQANDLKISLQNETKSTAGDKYETARAMLHMEQEKIAAQMIILQQHKATVESLSANQTNTSDTIQLGHLVLTDRGYFIIAASVGKIFVDNLTVFAISAEALLGKLMLGQKAGAQIAVNKTTYTLLSFC